MPAFGAEAPFEVAAYLFGRPHNIVRMGERVIVLDATPSGYKLSTQLRQETLQLACELSPLKPFAIYDLQNHCVASAADFTDDLTRMLHCALRSLPLAELRESVLGFDLPKQTQVLYQQAARMCRPDDARADIIALAHQLARLSASEFLSRCTYQAVAPMSGREQSYPRSSHGKSSGAATARARPVSSEHDDDCSVDTDDDYALRRPYRPPVEPLLKAPHSLGICLWVLADTVHAVVGPPRSSPSLCSNISDVMSSWAEEPYIRILPITPEVADDDYSSQKGEGFRDTLVETAAEKRVDSPSSSSASKCSIERVPAQKERAALEAAAAADEEDAHTDISMTSSAEDYGSFRGISAVSPVHLLAPGAAASVWFV